MRATTNPPVDATDAAAAAKIRNNPVIDLRIPVSVYKLTC